MANPSSHAQASRLELDLEREPTAQPRTLADDLGTISTPEDSLSLYPEDLGSHFLSEAVEQGDVSARDTLETERLLLEDAELEQGEASRSEIELWTRVLERVQPPDSQRARRSKLRS